jgi:two-component sensor histidine kinase
MESTISPAPRRILLIEDEEEHASLVERGFKRAGTYQLTVVSTIAAGAKAIRNLVFDLVIADWRLPDGDAFDLLTDNRRFPLLIMTSHGDEQVAVKAMRAGALDYVVKSESSLLDMPRLAEGAIRLWENVMAKELAEENLRRSLDEKTVLLKEIHHRVKNNLQIVCSLLSMQIDAVANGSAAMDPLKEAHSRVVAMSLVHEYIYRSDSLADLDFSKYIAALSERLFSVYCIDPSRIRLELDVKAIHLTVNDAIPCGLVLNELLSNSLKHAFRDGRKGVIRVSFARTGSEDVELAVADDGVGLPAGFRVEESLSLGLQVVRTLTHQLGAELHVDGEAGATFRLRWRNANVGHP